MTVESVEVNRNGSALIRYRRADGTSDVRLQTANGRGQIGRYEPAEASADLPAETPAAVEPAPAGIAGPTELPGPGEKLRIDVVNSDGHVRGSVIYNSDRMQDPVRRQRVLDDAADDLSREVARGDVGATVRYSIDTYTPAGRRTGTRDATPDPATPDASTSDGAAAPELSFEERRRQLAEEARRADLASEATRGGPKPVRTITRLGDVVAGELRNRSDADDNDPDLLGFRFNARGHVEITDLAKARAEVDNIIDIPEWELANGDPDPVMRKLYLQRVRAMRAFRERYLAEQPGRPPVADVDQVTEPGTAAEVKAGDRVLVPDPSGVDVATVTAVNPDPDTPGAVRIELGGEDGEPERILVTDRTSPLPTVTSDDTPGAGDDTAAPAEDDPQPVEITTPAAADTVTGITGDDTADAAADDVEEEPAPRPEIPSENVPVGELAAGDRIADTDGGEFTILGVHRDRATGQRVLALLDENGKRSKFMAADDVEMAATSRAPDPEPLDDESTPTARAAVAVYQRRALVALGVEASGNSDVAQAAARIRTGMPLTAAQARALSDDLNDRAGSETRAARQRSLRRLAAQVGAVGQELGDGTPPAVAGPTTPEKTRVADITEGDQVALVDVSGNVVTGKVVGRRRIMGGRLTEVSVEFEGNVEQHMLSRSAPIYLMPDLPEPVAVPDPEVDGAELTVAELTKALTLAQQGTELDQRVTDVRKAIDRAALAPTQDRISSIIGQVVGYEEFAKPPSEEQRNRILDQLALPENRLALIDGPVSDYDAANVSGAIAPATTPEARAGLVAQAQALMRAARADYVQRVVDGIADWPIITDGRHGFNMVPWLTRRDGEPDRERYRTVVRAAAGLDDAEAGPDVLPEGVLVDATADLGTQLAQLRAALPADFADLGRRRYRARTFEAVSVEDLDAGVAPALVDAEYFGDDRAVDGGPGVTALTHAAVFRVAGRLIDTQIERRYQELGGDQPEAGRLVADMANRVRRGQATLDVLRGLRPMGPTNTKRGDIPLNRGLIRRGELKAVREAQDYFPTDWLQYAAQVNNPLKVGRTDRGHYHDPDGTRSNIVLNLSADGDSAAVLVNKSDYAQVAKHELWHHMENTVPGLVAAEEAYVWTRTSTGEVGSRRRNPARAIEGGSPGEWAYDDEFASVYSGKAYESGIPGSRPQAFEVGSTGVESLFAGSPHLDGDPETRRWLLGVMALLGTEQADSSAAAAPVAAAQDAAAGPPAAVNATAAGVLPADLAGLSLEDLRALRTNPAVVGDVNALARVQQEIQRRATPPPAVASAAPTLTGLPRRRRAGRR